jgi:hypothetical protein
MRALSDAELLDLWDRGAPLHPLDRSLAALGTALPEADASPADWPLGMRNQALAELQCRCFGPRLSAWAACPRCAERMEFSLDAQDLARASAAKPTPTVSARGGTFRLPTSRDLARAARAADQDQAAHELLAACRLDDGAPRAWSREESEAIGEALAQADPLAEFRLGLACAACGHQWQEALDIGAFLWAGIEARARRLLMDVHALASAYGWSEAEILALSAPRRAHYLEAVRS